MSIHGDGEQTRDYTYIDDAVEATLLAAIHPRAEGDVFNVGTGHRDVRQPARPGRSARRSGTPVDLRHIDRRDIDNIRRRVVNIEKARRMLRWAPQVTLDRGLLQTAEWFVKARFAEEADADSGPLTATTPLLVADHPARSACSLCGDDRQTRTSRRRPRCAGSRPLLLVAAVLIHLPTLGAPLLDRHPFRQTQTAFTARIFHEQGIDLLHPKLPILGPPWEVPFEFPLFQAAAAVVMDAGVPEDTALRLTGLASFILAAGLLWLLVRRQAGWIGATVALDGLPVLAARDLVGPGGAHRVHRPGGVVRIRPGRPALARPVARAAWFALALALGLHRRAREDHDRRCSGSRRSRSSRSVATTTGGRVARGPGRGRCRSCRCWPGSPGPATRTAIKAASDATAWLTSGALSAWNFGTRRPAAAAGSWGSIYYERRSSWPARSPSLFLAYPAIRFALARRQIRFWTWIAATAVGPILVFFNLYVVHDYYAMAVSGLDRGPRRARCRRVCRWSAPGCAACSWPAATVALGRHRGAPEPVLDPGLRSDRRPGRRPAAGRPDRAGDARRTSRSPSWIATGRRRSCTTPTAGAVMINGHERDPVDSGRTAAQGYAIYSCPWDATVCVRLGG